MDEETGIPVRATGRKRGKARGTRFETGSSFLLAATSSATSSSSSSPSSDESGSEEEPEDVREKRALVATGGGGGGTARAATLASNDALSVGAAARVQQYPQNSLESKAAGTSRHRKKSLLKRGGRPGNQQQLTEAEEFRIVRDR